MTNAITKQRFHYTGQQSVFAFSSARSYVQGMDRQDNNNYTNDYFYFRGGSVELTSCERKVAELAEVKQGNLRLTTSGMSAVVTALEVADLTANDAIIHGAVEYGQIYNYISEDLPKRGIIPLEVNSGDISALENMLQIFVAHKSGVRIKAIFLETIGNGPTMPVLDIERFLSLPVLQKINPVIILDNTFPTNTNLKLGKYIEKSPLRVIGLESATKFYLANQDLGGFFFTYNNQLLQQLLKKRKRIGTTPGASLIRTFHSQLPQSRTQFDIRNNILMRNTQVLAQICSQAGQKNSEFHVIYPTLANHSNADYVRRHFPVAPAPVFFITAKEGSTLTAEEIFYRLDKLNAFKDMLITESFGFGKTGVSYCSRYGGYIRIAGGLESASEIDSIAKRLSRSLSRLVTRNKTAVIKSDYTSI